MCLFLGVRTKKCQAALPPQASSEYRDLLIGLFAKLLRGPLLLQAENQQGTMISRADTQMLPLSVQIARLFLFKKKEKRSLPSILAMRLVFSTSFLNC